MAYCVKCGVKLPDGAKSCPLCNTRVVLGEDMVEVPEKPLFKPDDGTSREKGLDRPRKAMLEIALIITFVSEVVLAFSLLPGPGAFLPMLCVLYGAVVFLIPVLAERPTYPVIATGEMIATGVLLVLIELFLTDEVVWSLVCLASFALVWMVSVMPFLLKKRLWLLILLEVIGVAGFMLALDAIFPPLNWVLTLGLPTQGFLLVLSLILLGRVKWKKLTQAALLDYVLAALAIICMTIGFGDWAACSFSGITWSRPLWISGILLFLIEILISATRKIRNFFNTRNGQLQK